MEPIQWTAENVFLMVGGFLIGWLIYKVYSHFFKEERVIEPSQECLMKLAKIRREDKKFSEMKSRAFTKALFEAVCNKMEKEMKELKEQATPTRGIL